MGEQQASARLVALVRAGVFRFALPAEAVLQVARLPAAVQARGLLEALGEPNPQQGEWGIALQGETRETFRVDAVEGVRERGTARVYNLPEGVGLEPAELVNGVFQVEGALAVELRPAWVGRLAPRPPLPDTDVRCSTEPASRALVATAAGRSLGFALPQVLAVVGKPAVCPVPRARPGVRGVVEHGQILYPALDVGGLYFGRPATGEFGVLVEQHGRASLVLVDEVRGMRAGFRAVSGAEPGWLEGERGERALFPRVDGT